MKTVKRILLMTLIAIFAVSAVGCSFSFSTAKIEDAIMTETMDQDGVPGEEVVSFTADAPVLYTSAKLRNAPDHTSIRIVWTYVTGDQFIDEVTLDSGTISDRYIYSNFTPSALLPEGEYQVEYFLNDNTEPDATVKFVILPAANQAAAIGAYLEDVSMTSAVDTNGYPVDQIDTVAPTGTWYVVAVLRNATADTMVHYVWYDTLGNVIDEYDFDPEGATDIYIFGSLTLGQVAPDGQYLVEIYIDGVTSPAAQIPFTVSAS